MQSPHGTRLWNKKKREGNDAKWKQNRSDPSRRLFWNSFQRSHLLDNATKWPVYCFTFLEARSLKSRCQQGHAIPESPKEASSSIFQLLVGASIIGAPWLGCPMGSHVLLLCVHLCLHFPLFIRTLVIGLKVKVKSLSCVWLFGTPWTAPHQAPLSMGFSRQEYWNGLPFPSPGDLPDPGI